MDTHCVHLNGARAYCCTCRTWSPPDTDTEPAATLHETTGRWS